MWVPTQEKDNNSSSSDRVDAFNIKEQRQPRETALLFLLYLGHYRKVLPISEESNRRSA